MIAWISARIMVQTLSETHPGKLDIDLDGAANTAAGWKIGLKNENHFLLPICLGDGASVSQH